MRSIIVGTAGHIDHGKTSLVRALTGVDADRLPEEKQRGITIDLGFAELDLGDVRVGFVDVPGHERFIKNMLAGAHGIDAVALVVAADEGVMPQTREHFDICRLLAVEAGLIVVTKTDAVDEELLELVQAEAEELVAGSFLEEAPIIATSARTGAGVDKLKNSLREMALRTAVRSAARVARLPIDRAFTMRGFGAVVTGTLIAGEIAEGDEMELLPSPVRSSVRVRGVQVHNRSVAQASAGQRTAINLGGVEAAMIERGMVLAPAGRISATQLIDAQVEMLKSAARPLRSRARVRLHLGAAEVLGRVAVLNETGEIAPGTNGFAQFRLESPVVALLDDRFIIRSYSPQQTIAGGLVLDTPAAKHRGRDRRHHIAQRRFTALTAADDATRLGVFVESAGEQGLRQASILARTGWPDEVLANAAAEAVRRGLVIEAESLYISRQGFEQFMQRTVEAVAAYHKKEPLARGFARETLREQVFAHAAPEIFRAVLMHSEKAGQLVSERDIVRSSHHTLQLSEADTKAHNRLMEIYQSAALEPPTVNEALEQLASLHKDSSREHGRKLLRLLIDAAVLTRIDEDLLFHRAALDLLIKSLGEYAARHEPERTIDMATFKDLAGVSRKYAIPLLEHLDRERITRRAGDRRIIL